MVKKDVKSKVAVLALNSPELSLLKFLPLTYHHSHFLAATLDFTSFEGRTLFLQLGCFGLDNNKKNKEKKTETLETRISEMTRAISFKFGM